MSWGFYNSSGFLKTSTGRELVSTLPSSPVNGQEVFYQASGTMATDGVVWHLRYNSSSSSSYKWEFLGGGSLNWLDGSNTSASITTTFANISTAQKITVPLAGDYEVRWSTTTIRTDAQQSTYVGVKVDTTDPTLDTVVGTAATATYSNTAASVWGNHSQVRRISGISANKDLTIVYRLGFWNSYYK